MAGWIAEILVTLFCYLLILLYVYQTNIAEYKAYWLIVFQ